MYTPRLGDKKQYDKKLRVSNAKFLKQIETLSARVSFLSIEFGAGGAVKNTSSLAPAEPAKTDRELSARLDQTHQVCGPGDAGKNPQVIQRQKIRNVLRVLQTPKQIVNVRLSIQNPVACQTMGVYIIINTQIHIYIYIYGCTCM